MNNWRLEIYLGCDGGGCVVGLRFSCLGFVGLGIGDVGGWGGCVVCEDEFEGECELE